MIFDEWARREVQRWEKQRVDRKTHEPDGRQKCSVSTVE